MAGSTHTFTKTYSSTVSEADAQAMADADSLFELEGQAYANSIGTCSEDPPAPSYNIHSMSIPQGSTGAACGGTNYHMDAYTLPSDLAPTVTMQLYSDEACTTPLMVSGWVRILWGGSSNNGLKHSLNLTDGEVTEWSLCS